MERGRAAWYNVGPGDAGIPDIHGGPMAKPHRTLKKANHGSRPANSKARKAKRKHIRT